jgi:hypothetical protein
MFVKMRSVDCLHEKKPPLPAKSPLRYVHAQACRHAQNVANQGHDEADYLDQHYAGVYAAINELAEQIECHRQETLPTDQISISSTAPPSTASRSKRRNQSTPSSCSSGSRSRSSPASSIYSQPSTTNLDCDSLTSASARTSSSFESERSSRRFSTLWDPSKSHHPQYDIPEDATLEVMTDDVFQLIEQLPPIIYDREKLVSFRSEDFVADYESSVCLPLFPPHPAVRPRSQTMMSAPVVASRATVAVPNRGSSLRQLRKRVFRQ